MKKWFGKKIILSFLSVFVFFILFYGANAQNSTNNQNFRIFKEPQFFKVIKIVDGDTVYVDFNCDNFPNKTERVRLNGIDAFENKVNKGLKSQMKKYNLTQDETLTLGYLGYLFAKEELLGKYVKIKYSAKEKYDKYNRPLVSIYYDCENKKCKNFEQEMLKQGLASIYAPSNLSSKLKKYENTQLFYINLENTEKIDTKLLYQFTY